MEHQFITPSLFSDYRKFLKSSQPDNRIHHERQNNQCVQRSQFVQQSPTKARTTFNGDNKKKSCRHRTVYTSTQRMTLEAQYKQNKYVKLETTVKLSESLGVSEKQIKIWFRNKRYKEKKQMKELFQSVQVSSENDTSSIFTFENQNASFGVLETYLKQFSPKRGDDIQAVQAEQEVNMMADQMYSYHLQDLVSNENYQSEGLLNNKYSWYSGTVPNYYAGVETENSQIQLGNERNTYFESLPDYYLPNQLYYDNTTFPYFMGNAALKPEYY